LPLALEITAGGNRDQQAALMASARGQHHAAARPVTRMTTAPAMISLLWLEEKSIAASL
jgi:hypothetical protein